LIKNTRSIFIKNDLSLLDMDPAAGRPEVELRAAAVDLGLERAAVDLALDGDREVGRDVAAAGVGIDVHGDVGGKGHRDAPSRRG